MVVSLVLVGVISVGATMAYLTSKTAVATNTFTVGKVGITQKEEAWDASKAVLVPGLEIPKNPTVTVDANSEPCHVYMKVIIPDEIKALQTAKDSTNKSIVDIDFNSNWELVTGYTDVYKYKTTVSKNTTAATPLPAIFTRVKVSSEATSVQMATLGATKDIKVASFAIQANDNSITDTALAAQVSAWSATVS